jgi:hypothetical protein
MAHRNPLLNKHSHHYFARFALFISTVLVFMALLSISQALQV